MPDIELKGDLVDPLTVLALMVFPTDEEQRRNYHSIRSAESQLDAASGSTSLELKSDLLRAIIKSPNKSELFDQMGRQVREAMVAGTYLATLFVMSLFPNDFNEPSSRKAVYVTRCLAKESKYGDGSEMYKSDTKIRKCIDNYRSVAHLWAATILYDRARFQDFTDFLDNDEALQDFLSIGASIQDFGCNFVADRPRRRDQRTVLDPASIWKLPATVERFTPSWESPPDWMTEALNEYKVEK